MKYLIDTQIFLWFISGSPELSKKAKKILENGDNEIFISIASLWEISIKTSLGKLVINGPYSSVIDDVIENEIEILPINFVHTVEQNKLPFHHKDPFDRLIVAQALVEEINLVSSDKIFDEYIKNVLIKRIF